MSYRNVLCAVDFSPASELALRAAVRQTAPTLDARLTLIHVVDYPVLAFPALAFDSDLRTRLDDTARPELLRLKEEAQALGALQLSTVLDHGQPWHVIVDRAIGQRHDLIVVGSTGRSGLTQALFGSVAERIVRHAPCDVLIARDAVRPL
jgi:nucleotide-binding universal stress UspA family protein